MIFTHGLIKGWASRTLLDAAAWTEKEAGMAMHQALSKKSDHWDAAFWLEGFLHGSGLLLLLAEELWSVLDEWVESIDPAQFEGIMVVVRRGFSAFSSHEKQKILRKVIDGEHDLQLAPKTEVSETDRSHIIAPTIEKILGWK